MFITKDQLLIQLMFFSSSCYMEAGGSSVMSTDIKKWISGETDVFFNPGKAQKGSPFWKRAHYVIAIVVSAGCVLTVIGSSVRAYFPLRHPSQRLPLTHRPYRCLLGCQPHPPLPLI